MAGTGGSEVVRGGLAYVNGLVFTVDTKLPWADGFIVDSDGKFITVGSNADVTKEAQKHQMVIRDLKGHFIMPGIHDAHVHMIMPSIAMTSHAQLDSESLTKDNVAEQLEKGGCRCKYVNVRQDWIEGTIGHIIEDFHRSSLDQKYPSTPVVIHGGAGHAAFLNTAALERSGYDIAGEPDGQGTMYKRDTQGLLTGEMGEMSLSKLAHALPKVSQAHVKRVLVEAQQKLHAAGVTSLQEAATGTQGLTALLDLDEDGLLKLDVATHLVYSPDWLPEESFESLHALIDQAKSYQSRHVDSRFVKIILDGTPIPPYYNHASLDAKGQVETKNLHLVDAEATLKAVIQKYDAQGMTVKIHCTGRGSTRLTFDAIEHTRRLNHSNSDQPGPRHEIAHCNAVHEDDYSRFKALNVTAEMSPASYFLHPSTLASPELMDWNFTRLAAADAHVTIGSDWGIGMPPDLLPWMGGKLPEIIGHGDRVAGAKALIRMLTLNGAKAVGHDKDTGSIEVGKRANFIAVDKNLAEGEFDGASVVTTWFEGVVVYDKSC